MFEAMQAGWATQQRSRQLKANTIESRLAVVRRFAKFTNQYPWEWNPTEWEAYIGSLAGARPTTVRGYQASIRLFLEYVTSAEYEWLEACRERFGAVPRQVVTEWNSCHHTTPYEGRPGRRPLTYDEVQELFDAADGLAESIQVRRRKGSLAAKGFHRS